MPGTRAVPSMVAIDLATAPPLVGFRHVRGHVPQDPGRATDAHKAFLGSGEPTGEVRQGHGGGKAAPAGRMGRKAGYIEGVPWTVGFVVGTRLTDPAVSGTDDVDLLDAFGAI